MKKYFYVLLILMFSVFTLQSCSSSEKTTKNEEKKTDEDVYVFDEVPSDTTKTVDKTEHYTTSFTLPYYKIQIGAFTSKEKAEEFASVIRAKLQDELDVSYSEEVNLFVVRLRSSFKSKEKAEEVRNQLWQIEEFKDAWIVTINE